MSSLLRKLAATGSIPEQVASTAWRGVSESALRDRGDRLYGTQLIPGFEETAAERVFILPDRKTYREQVARGEREPAPNIGEARSDMYNAKRAISFLSKVSRMISMEADDGDFERYEVKDGNPEGRDYSDIRDRDIQTGLDIAWKSHETFAPGSDTPSVSGENPTLQRRPQEQKYASTAVQSYADLSRLAKLYADRIKSAVQSENVVEGEDEYPDAGGSRAELTDSQQERAVSERFDAVEHYAPSGEEAHNGTVFQWSEHNKIGSVLPPNREWVEDEEARGLPQWPDVDNDSRDSGQGDEPTSRAWAEHDSFEVTDMPSADAQGNPGPSP